MKSITRAGCASVLAVAAGFAQTTLHLRTQGRAVDFSGASSTKPFRLGVSLPATCSVGETMLRTDTPAGQNLYVCTAANVWSLQAGAASSGPGFVAPLSVTLGGTGGTSFTNRAIVVGAGSDPLASSGCTVGIDAALSCAGGLSVGTGSTEPGESLLYDASGGKYVSWLSPAAILNSVRYRFPASPPSSGQVMSFGAPNGGISDISFITPLSAGGAYDDPAWLTGLSWSKIKNPPLAGGGSGARTVVPLSATPVFACTAAVQAFEMTLGATEVTGSTLSGCAPGTAITFKICQDGAGGRTFTPPANQIGFGAVEAEAGACSSQSFSYDGTNLVALAPMYVTGLRGGALTLGGSSSGSNTIQPSANAGAGSTTTLPAGNSTTVLPDAGAAHQFLTGITAGGVVTKAQPTFADVGGTASADQLPNPGPSSKGGVKSVSCAAGQHLASINADGGGTCTADSGGGAAGLSRSGVKVFEDDFLAGSITNGTIGQWGWVTGSIGAAPAITYEAAVAGHPGILKLSTGAVANNGFSMTPTYTQSILPAPVSFSPWEVQYTFKLAGAANETVYFGLASASSTGTANPPYDGVWIRYDTTAPDMEWVVITAASNTRTAPVSTGVAVTASNWFTLRIQSTATGTIGVSVAVDGGAFGAPVTVCPSGCTINTALNAYPMQPFLQMYTRAAGAQSILLDWAGISYTVSR